MAEKGGNKLVEISISRQKVARAQSCFPWLFPTKNIKEVYKIITICKRNRSLQQYYAGLDSLRQLILHSYFIVQKAHSSIVCSL